MSFDTNTSGENPIPENVVAAVYNLFWDTVAEKTFPNASKITLSIALWLVLYGTNENWLMYSNNNSDTKVTDVDKLLETLYIYFTNPKYLVPDDGDLESDERMLYDLVTKRLPRWSIPSIVEKTVNAMSGWLSGVDVQIVRK